MKDISSRQTVERSIFSAELQLNPEAIDRRLVAEKNLRYSDLQVLQGDLINVGEPRWWDLADVAASQGIEPKPEVRVELKESDFWLM